MIERRNAQRTAAQAVCMLSVEGRQIEARLENLTDQGALFSLRRTFNDEAPAFYLGRDATFVSTSFKPARRYTGKIIRLFYQDGAPHIALRFLRKYETVTAS
jgi:hypothetical protein